MASSEGVRDGDSTAASLESLVFVDQTLDENLRCPICLEACLDATTACASGHTFCGPCLARMSARGDEKCPTCRADRINLPNRPLREMVHALRVRCGEGKGDGDGSRKKRRTEGEGKEEERGGCGWQGILGQWHDDHKNACPFVTIGCPLHCPMMVRRMDLDRHMEECPHREVECMACNARMRHDRLDTHKLHACPKAVVKCQYCNEEMERQALGEKQYSPPQESFPGVENIDYRGIVREYTGHLAVCPKAILSCEFSARGCRVKFAREDAAAHHAENAQYHAALVDQTLQRLYKWMNWDFVQACWPISYDRIAGGSRSVIKSAVVRSDSPYQLFLKMCLQGPDDPISVAICSESIGCNPFDSNVGLKKIHVRVTDGSVNVPLTYAAVELDKECTVRTRRNSPGAFEFNIVLKNALDGSEYTRAHLLREIGDDIDSSCAVRINFCIHKVTTVMVQTESVE